MYDYKCDYCHAERDEFQKMSSEPLTVCPVCGASAYHRVPSLPSTDLKEFDKPIEMFSIGLNDDEEIREFKAKCPDVDVATDPNDPLYGVPIARSRSQKKTALAAMGFVERN